MIVDTNILLHSLRGKKEAIHFLESSDVEFSVSVVSITELYAGLRGEQETLKLQEFLKTFVIHPVEQDVARVAGEYLNYYAKSHHFGIADALIAATSKLSGEQIATLNVKDFPMLDVLKPY